MVPLKCLQLLLQETQQKIENLWYKVLDFFHTYLF